MKSWKCCAPGLLTQTNSLPSCHPHRPVKCNPGHGGDGATLTHSARCAWTLLRSVKQHKAPKRYRPLYCSFTLLVGNYQRCTSRRVPAEPRQQVAEPSCLLRCTFILLYIGSALSDRNSNGMSSCLLLRSQCAQTWLLGRECVRQFAAAAEHGGGVLHLLHLAVAATKALQRFYMLDGTATCYMGLSKKKLQRRPNLKAPLVLRTLVSAVAAHFLLFNG